MADLAYGGSRARWSGRLSTGGRRLPYCASRAFLHSFPHRNLRCNLQHFNAERKFESARLSPNRVRQDLCIDCWLAPYHSNRATILRESPREVPPCPYTTTSATTARSPLRRSSP